jgi:putative endonuclease
VAERKSGDVGRWGERMAEKFLKRQGYRLVARRARIGRRDELDLVVWRDDTLVFVEVKTRRSETFGRPAQAVDRHKRQVLSRAAVRYLGRLKTPPPFFRFDIVEVIGAMDGADPEIRHLENAFPLDARYRPL